MEARPLNSEVLTRRCVLARLQDLTVDRFRELIAQGAGAVLILLPRNMSHVLQQSVEVSAKYNSLASDFQKEKILEEIHKNIPECTFSLKEKEGRRGEGVTENVFPWLVVRDAHCTSQNYFGYTF